MAILRSVLAIVLGLMAFVVTVMFFDGLAGVVGGQTAPKSLEEYTLNLANYPASFFIIMMSGWYLGAFVGPAIATIVAQRGKWIHGAAIGVFGFLGTAINGVLVPHPTWVKIGIIPIPIVICLAIYRFSRTKSDV